MTANLRRLRLATPPSTAAAALFLLLAAAAAAGSPCAIPAIFNFGDSTSDTGGIHVSFPFRTHAEQFPYGQTFFHHPAFRYSDGRLLIDFLAEGLGKPFIGPYLRSVDANFTHGANFASSGATAAPPFFISPFNLPVQINQFKVFKQQVMAALLKPHERARRYLPDAKAFSEGLYVIEIGGNDLSYGYMNLKMNTEQIKGYLPTVVEAISDAIKELYKEGARRFWVLDVGPQGCMPFALTRYAEMIREGDLDAYGCARPFNDAVTLYNRLLREELLRLRSILRASSISFVDTFHVQFSFLQNPHHYGFNHTTRACCGVGGKYNYNFIVQCGASYHLNGQFLTALSCVNPSEYINWDGVHLTDRANEILARQILSGSYFRPYFPLFELCPPRVNV